MCATEIPEITPSEARRVVRTLADGVPPRDHFTRWLTVGQDDLLREFDADLAAVAEGEFRSLLLLGNPGLGKSHLLTTLQFMSVERGFVTAYFSQDVQSKLAFNRPDQIYARIVETMRLPNQLDSADSLQSIMDRWASLALSRLRGVRRSMGIAYKLSEAGLLPAETLKIHPRTRVALVGYVMATEQQNEEARKGFLRVLRGPGLTSGHLIGLARSVGLERKAFIGYTPNQGDAEYYFGQLRTLVFILRRLGYKGLTTLFDEVTAIVDLRFPQSREKAYKVLDSLFFNNYEYQGLYTVFAYMPPFVTQLRTDQQSTGKDFIERWRDLWDKRVRELGSLNEKHMLELLRRLAMLHGIAHSWEAWREVVSDSPNLVRACKREELTTRDFVRRGLQLLDERYSANKRTH